MVAQLRPTRRPRHGGQRSDNASSGGGCRGTEGRGFSSARLASGAASGSYPDYATRLDIKPHEVLNALTNGRRKMVLIFDAVEESIEPTVIADHCFVRSVDMATSGW